MKRPIVPILIVFLACGIAVAATRLLYRQSPQPTSVRPASDPIVKKASSIHYKGVSFNFDPSLATEVTSETIPAMTEGQPSDIIPEHPSFRLIGYPRLQNMSPGDPEIKVFSVAEFREAMHHACVELAKVTYPPMEDLGPAVDEEVRVLRALVETKPRQADVGRFLAKARGQKGCGAAMPFLPMWEACQAFAGHVRYVNFKGGKGVFFLTQWDRETTQITNDGLEYVFQGITDDGKYYVYGEFSVQAPFLPRGDEPEVVAWAEKNYLLSHNSKEYQNYLRPVQAKLEALPSDKFQPNLELLEQLIQSLEIQSK